MGKVVKMFKSRVNVESIYEKFFKSMNGVLGLTDKELKVASVFYRYKNDLNKSILDNDIANNVLFSSDYRKRIREEVNLTPMGLNNYIAALKDKKMISDNNQLNKAFEFDYTNGVTVTFDIDVDVV